MTDLRSDIVSLHGVANSMIGGRPENQDDFDFLDTPLGFLCIVCDGMGGGPGGKTASYLAKYEISMAICQCNSSTPRENALKMAIAKANEAIEEKMREVPSLNGMGTTVVAILINQESALVAHAGDSRCYQIRNGKCIYRSHDHSLVAQLVEKKVMTEEEARISPQANVITRGLGSTSNHVPEIDVLSYKKGDRFIICTDGVWGSMPHKELLQRFLQKISVSYMVTNLSQEVDQIGNSKGGGHDNHTIAVVEMNSNSLYKGKLDKKKIFYISLFSLLTAIAVVVLLFIFKASHKEDSNEDNNQISEIINPPFVNPNIKKEATDYSRRQIEVSIDTQSNDGIDMREAVEQYRTNSENPKSTETTAASNTETKTDSDAVTDKNEAVRVTQLAIEGYEEAINLSGKDVKKTQSKAYEIRDKVVKLLEKLYNLTEGREIQRDVDSVITKTKPDSLWFVLDMPINKKYKLTVPGRKNAQKQKERLDSIKTQL